MNITGRLQKILSSNAFVSLAGNGTAALLGILVIAIQARTLTKTDFGTWVMFITTFGLFDIIRSGLILNPVIRNLAAAKNDLAQRRIAGAAWSLCSNFTVWAVVLFTIPGLLFYNWFQSQDLGFFVQWFWLLAVITVPHNLATWFLNASSGFKTVQAIKITNQALFMAFNVANIWLDMGISYIFWAFVICNLATSVVTLLAGWSRITDWKFSRKEEKRELFSFGKFSMLTLVVSNLLRSSDTYLLGIMLGPAAVVLYNVPSRLMQVFEMPISAISITRLPVLAGLHTSGKDKELAAEFERSVGVLWLAIIPVAILCFIFAEPLVVLLGGEGFRESAGVLRFFAIYAVFLPLERYSGIGLDVVNRPKINLIKVVIMLGVNVVGDIIAIKYFGTVDAVAFVSVITFGSGILLGYYFLNRHMKLSLKGILTGGWLALKKVAGK